jgi:hypothetical protein
MSGVEPTQQPPPGWLTSARPSNCGVVGSSPNATVEEPTVRSVVVPLSVTLRSTLMVTGPSVAAKFSMETKSRSGKTVMLRGVVGGSLSVV